MTETNLEKVYTEMKRVRVELKSIERTLESLAESLIPKEKASPAEIKSLNLLGVKRNVETAFLWKKCLKSTE